MGQMNSHHHAHHLVEITGLIVHDVVCPIFRIDDARELKGGIIRRAAEILHVLIEKTGLGSVNRLGVRQMIDQVDESRGNGNLAHHFVVLGTDDGRDLRNVLGLQGDGVGGDLAAKFWRQRVV